MKDKTSHSIISRGQFYKSLLKVHKNMMYNAENQQYVENVTNVDCKRSAKILCTSQELYEVYFNLPTDIRNKYFATATKAGEIIGVTKRTILRWIKIGALKSIYIGNRYYVSIDELKNKVKSGEVEMVN
jgi:hypothetical protein